MYNVRFVLLFNFTYICNIKYSVNNAIKCYNRAKCGSFLCLHENERVSENIIL
jgi:hypothetical protein